MILSNKQQNLIFGSLLGDGSLQTFNGGKSWRYRALQKDKQYLFHKYDILKSLCSSEPTFSQTTDLRTQTVSNRYAFNTLTQDSLRFYGNMFYTFDRNKQLWVKDVPFHVAKFLNDEALAYFYMDDGALKYKGKSNAMRICTEGFSNEGVIRLNNAIIKNFSIQTGVSKHKSSNGREGLRISIPEAASAEFRELIKPYLVDCMKYKVSDGNYGHL
jgi:LAGLIDADG DNA endonuclease family protein